jgi:hypothetical protein
MSKLAIVAAILPAAGQRLDLPSVSLSREIDCLRHARRLHRRANRHLALGVVLA